jgi:hypothetical protein
MAHIRAPNPQNYFPRRQETSTSEQEPLDDTGHRSRNTDQIVTNHQEFGNCDTHYVHIWKTKGYAGKPVLPDFQIVL